MSALHEWVEFAMLLFIAVLITDMLEAICEVVTRAWRK